MRRDLAKVTIREWTGMVSNRGPFAGKPGDAKVQENLRCLKPGVLETRGGYRRLGLT